MERIGGWESVIAFAHAAQLQEIAELASTASGDVAFGDNPEQVYSRLGPPPRHPGPAPIPAPTATKLLGFDPAVRAPRG